MENKLRHYRWTLMINGIIALLFGLFALFVPETATKTIALYFGIVLIAGGIIGMIAGIRNMKLGQAYMSTLVTSIISTLIGILVVAYTRQSLQIFAIIIGIWAIALGLVQLIIALNLLAGRQKNIMLFNSIITLLFGLILFFNPFGSMVALVFLVGILAIVFGAVLIYFGMNLKSIEEEL